MKHSLLDLLQDAKTEEDVKARYAKFFGLKYNTADKHDLYTDEVLFEFKNDVNLSSLSGKAKVLAQILYYIYRLKFKQNGQFTKKAIPPFLCLADKNEAVLTETAVWKKFYSSENYDWDFQPSSPDPKLIEDIKNDPYFREKVKTYVLPQGLDYEIFVEKLRKIFDPQFSLDLGVELDKKIITEDNFEEVFQYWDEIFHDDVQNGLKSSRYFVCDIQDKKTEYSEMKGGVNFYFSEEKSTFKPILKSKYDQFWSIYQKITNPAEISGIIAKIDRLTDDTLRRFEGQFFTPLDFAKKGLEYLESVLGKNFYKEYKIWDMCAGTGNLEWFIPSEHYHNVYVSSLSEDEVDHMKKALFPIPPENVFQYDYLNDDVDLLFADKDQISAELFEDKWKLPKNLREELKNPENKWVILINPPYATSTNYGESHKGNVSDTKIRKKMWEKGLGNSSQELFCQFLFRIEQEFPGKKTFLGLYSKIKYINSNAYEEFRKKLFDFSFKKGFLFHSKNFTGNKGSFPVGFLIWDLLKRKPLEKQKIIVDIFESTIRKLEMIRGSAVKIGQKLLRICTKDRLLNKWIVRPKNETISPPLSSAITQYSSKVYLDKIPNNNGLGYMYCGGNDFQTAPTQTSILSSAYGNAHGIGITRENYDKISVIFCARKIPKATWINDRDQFLQPSKELSQEFITDCVVWSLFSGSNQSSSLRNVEYKEKIYQIKNEFFPYSSTEISKWDIQNPEIKAQIPTENRFVAENLRKKSLSPEATEVLRIGKEIYQEFFANFNHLDRTKFKLHNWDCGWWQIRMALSNQNFADNLFVQLKTAHKTLKEKLLPQIYELGFLPEEKMEDEG